MFAAIHVSHLPLRVQSQVVLDVGDKREVGVHGRPGFGMGLGSA